MIDPIFWLALSLFLVAISLTAVLVVAVPAIQEIARAARSVEKLFDTLSRELPPTLEAIRLTGLEISELTDDVTESVKSAAQVAKQVDASFTEVRHQAKSARTTTRSMMAGMRAAWKTLTQPEDLNTSSRARLGGSYPSREPGEPPSGSRVQERSSPLDAPIPPPERTRDQSQPDRSGSLGDQYNPSLPADRPIMPPNPPKLGHPLQLPQRLQQVLPKPSPPLTDKPLAMPDLAITDDMSLYDDVNS